MHIDHFKEHFQTITDLRQSPKVTYCLIEVLFGSLCAVIAGAKGWFDIREYILAHHNWFKRNVTIHPRANERWRMSKNQVQFQKGISIHKFMSDYGSEKQCQNRLFAIRWPNGFICPNCHSRRHCHLNSRSIYQCNSCHVQTSLTSGTILASTKLPLKIWFLAIFLLTQAKNGISALELSRHLGISYNATWRLKHKLMQAMKEFDDKQSLEFIVKLAENRW